MTIMKRKEYAIKRDGVFIHEEGPKWGTRQVALYTREEAYEYIRGEELIYYPEGQRPKLELYERDVETRVTPWRKAKKRRSHEAQGHGGQS